MNNHDISLALPPHRPSKLHKRSSSSPDDPNKPLPPPPPSPHRRRLLKRSSGSSHHLNQHHHQQMPDPGPLAIPPTLTSSDLSMDKELLQRWSRRESPHDTSSQRPPSYTKRHASFDSPREVPLPSPSLSLSSPGVLAPSPSSLFSSISSGATPSVNPASHSQIVSSSSKLQEITDYFPALFSPPKAESSSSSGSSSRSSQSSNRVSYPQKRTFSSGHYPVFEDEEHQGHDYGRGDSDLSDWTRQTSPSVSSVMCDSTQENQHADQPSTRSLAGSDHTHRSIETADAASGLGSSAMTPSTRPLNTLEGNHTYAATTGTGIRTTAAATAIFPFSRPYSLPDAHSSPPKSYNTAGNALTMTTSDVSSSSQGAGAFVAKGAAPELNPSWPDRSSSASLPLPCQIPFHILSTLERAATDFPNPSDGNESSGYFSDLGGAGSSRPEPRHLHTHNQHNNPYQCPQNKHPQSSTRSSPGSSLLSAESDENADEPSADLAATPGHDTTSAGADKQAHGQAPSPAQQSHWRQQSFPQPQPQPQPHPQPQPQTQSHCPPPPPHRPVSPFRAPQPRPELPSQSSGPPSMAYSASASSYPAPDPPVILGPTSDTSHRAYEPFLSHAPPPADSWIEVETSTGEYRLNVRLPGFRRDGITLATKRRRILHVVADSWENGGGHFERRISFGYDADLGQVRAEFDGEMLTISIPRRLPPVNFWQSLRPAPIGRPR